MLRLTPSTDQSGQAELESDFRVQDSLEQAITLLVTPTEMKLDLR